MSGAPGPLPSPPGDLSARSLPVASIAGPLYRFHGRDRRALYFGRASTWRFDDPDGRYGVCYTATDAHAAFAETFPEALRAGVISEPQIGARRLARISATRRLQVVDLVVSGGLARIGADARLFAGEHAVARAWSAAIHGHPSKPDGILCPARHDPARSVCALFDRAKPALGAEDLGSLLEPRLQGALRDILGTYGIGLIASG